MENINNHVNNINCLYSQIASLLDLMSQCGKGTDLESIRTSSEMCASMLDEIKVEVDKIEIELEAHQEESNE